MRVSIAVVKLVLRTNKVLSDGTHPIMLRCSFNGMKERSTGYSCSPKFWDKRNECVRKGYPNFVMVNYELKRLKDEAIAKRDSYIASGEVYSPAMVLARDEVKNAVTNDFCGLIERYIAEKGLESKTIEKWNIVKRNVVKFAGRDILVNEIDESFCRRYGRWLEERGMTSGSIRSYLGKVGALCHFAIAKGLMSSYPFAGWAYHKDYRESKSELYINHRSMEIMIDMFLDEIIERDGNRWNYRYEKLEELMDIHSELYAHYLYIVGYYMKGLSPVDLSMLKKSDFRYIQLKGVNCYAIDGSREKTGMLYKIRLEENCLLSNVLIKTMLMFHQGKYFLPTIEGYTGKDVKKRVNNLYTYHGDHLVTWFQRVNERIAEINVMNDHKDDIPLIDLDCRYYSYRHSYIMKELQKPNVNLLALAQSVGKSSHTLHQYISLLGDVDLL